MRCVWQLYVMKSLLVFTTVIAITSAASAEWPLVGNWRELNKNSNETNDVVDFVINYFRTTCNKGNRESTTETDVTLQR